MDLNVYLGYFSELYINGYKQSFNSKWVYERSDFIWHDKAFLLHSFYQSEATQVLKISNLFPLHSMQQLLNAFVFFLGAVSNQCQFFSFNDKKINIT
mgnify:FL=1